MKKTLLVSLLAAATLITGCSGTKNTNVKVFKSIALTDETYAFAVSKENTELKEKVNTILADMKADGSLDTLINNYFDGNSTFEYANPSVSDVKAGSSKYLVVGTSANFPPFEYLSGNKFTGVDMEIASILAEKMGKELYISDMEFDSLIPSITSNQVDLAMAGMTVTEKRLKTVDFCEEYYQSAQVITTLETDTTYDNCKTASDVEAILLKQNSNYKVGTQKGTTGYMYSAGDEDFGYDGFKNLTTKDYSTGALAMKDLQNGNLNAVILDLQPSLMIAEQMNK